MTDHCSCPCPARAPDVILPPPGPPLRGPTPPFLPRPARIRGVGKTGTPEQGRMTMPQQTRPLIGVNADFLAAGKAQHAQLRLAPGYVDAIVAAGGLPVVVPPVGR